MGGRDRREGGVGSGGGRLMARKKQVDKEEIIEYASEHLKSFMTSFTKDTQLSLKTSWLQV